MNWLRELVNGIRELKHKLTYPRYAVITNLPEDYDGCECDELLISRLDSELGAGPHDWVYHLPTDEEINEPGGMEVIHARLPLYKIGEVLLLNEWGRDIIDNRCPSKHWVEAKSFRFSWQAAREVRRLAKEPARPLMKRLSYMRKLQQSALESALSKLTCL